MNIYGHWQSEEIQPNSQAFTYKVWFLGINKRYIGVKKLFDPRGKEYPWEEYTTNSKEVKRLLSEGYVACFTIVEWFDNYDDARYMEMQALTAYDVTNNDQYLNKHIGGKKWGIQTQESIAKMSKTKTGQKINISDERKDQLRGQIQRINTPEVIATRAAGNVGKKRTLEQRSRMSIGQKSRTDNKRPKFNKGDTPWNKGLTYTDEQKKNIIAHNRNRDQSGSKNGFFKGYYQTPTGKFESLASAAYANGCSSQTISNRCNSVKFPDYIFTPKQKE